MAKRGELSHSRHTIKIPPEEELWPTVWPTDWPTIDDVHSFWYFGIQQRDIAPERTEASSKEGMDRWARRVNLVGESGAPPEWLILCGVHPRFISEHSKRAIDMSILVLDFDSTELPPYVEGIGQLAGSMPLSELAKGRVPGSDPASTQRKNLVRRVKASLRYAVGIETRATAKKRIMNALEVWVEDQLFACELRALLYPRNRLGLGFLATELELFIRFQCEGVPVKKLTESGVVKEDPGSSVRKILQRVASRLGIKLRRDRSGRPRKNTGN